MLNVWLPSAKHFARPRTLTVFVISATYRYKQNRGQRMQALGFGLTRWVQVFKIPWRDLLLLWVLLSLLLSTGMPVEMYLFSLTEIQFLKVIAMGNICFLDLLN